MSQSQPFQQSRRQQQQREQQHQQQQGQHTEDPRVAIIKNSAQFFRKTEQAVRANGTSASFFAMQFLHNVLPQPPRRPDVVRKRRYDASLSLMDVIRGHADNTTRLDSQWPIEYPLATVDAVRRTLMPMGAIDGNNNSTSNSSSSSSSSSAASGGGGGDDSSSSYLSNQDSPSAVIAAKRKQQRKLAQMGMGNKSGSLGEESDEDEDEQEEGNQKQKQQQQAQKSNPLADRQLMFCMRTLTTLRIPLLRIGVTPTLLHFWGILDPVDPLRDGWLFMPESDTKGSDGDVYRFAVDHAALNLFVDWPASTFLHQDDDDADKDEGPAWLTGLKVTIPSGDCLVDCREEIYPANTKPGHNLATPKRAHFVAGHVMQQCSTKLDLPMSIEYVVKAAFSEWAVMWRAKRAVVRTSMTEPDLAAAAALEELMNSNSRGSKMVNPLLELEGYAARKTMQEQKEADRRRIGLANKRKLQQEVEVVELFDDELAREMKTKKTKQQQQEERDYYDYEDSSNNNNNQSSAAAVGGGGGGGGTTQSLTTSSSLISADVDSNPFVSLGAFVCARLRGLTDHCMSCGTELSCNVVRPSSCGLELCNYSISKYGRDFLSRIKRGNGAILEFLILCAINAVAGHREMLVPMCDLLIDDQDGSVSEVKYSSSSSSSSNNNNNSNNNYYSGGSYDSSLSMIASRFSGSLMPSGTSSTVFGGSLSSPSSLTTPPPSSPLTSAFAAGGGGGDQDAADPLRDPSLASPISGSPASPGSLNLSPQFLASPATTTSTSATSAAAGVGGEGGKTKKRRAEAFQIPPDVARHFYKKEDDIGSGVNKNTSLVQKTLLALPPVPRMMAALTALARMTSPNQIEQRFFDWITKECGESEEGRMLAGPLIRWLFSSLQGDLLLLPKTHLIPKMRSEIQFLVVGNDPEREARFQALKQRELERRRIALEQSGKSRSFFSLEIDTDPILDVPDEKNDIFISGTKSRGSFFAFHGSGPGNWHSILRNGLKNLSFSSLMSTGALHGGGVYLSRSLHIALSYSLQPNSNGAWKKGSIIGDKGISVVSLCEVVDHKNISSSSPDPRFHRTYPEKSKVTASPNDPIAITSEGQIVIVKESDYVMLRAVIVYVGATPKHMEGYELEIPPALLSFMETQYQT